MIGALALLALFGSDPVADQTCRERGLDHAVGLGDAKAPRTLRFYFDPAGGADLQKWLEVRRLVGERPTEMRLELVVVRTGRSEPEADLTRHWFMAVSALGETEAAMRLLARRGAVDLRLALGTPEGRDEMARAVGLDPAVVAERSRGDSGRCLARDLDASTKDLASHVSTQAGSNMLGVIESDGSQTVHYVSDSALTDFRAVLDGSLEKSPEVGFGFTPMTMAPIGTRAEFDRTFPNSGVLVGGHALPHQLVIFIEDEESGKLSAWLSPALAYRRENPGELAVQVIAVGVGTRAISFRRRLCAARTLGLEVEFLDYLALPTRSRQVYEAELTEVLQPIADSDACSDSEVLDFGNGPDGQPLGDFGHPRDAFLDGSQVQHAGELENLAWRLATQPPSLVDWLLATEQALESSF